MLSFWNLVEAHVLRALRSDHGVSIKALREALCFAEGELKVKRLLLSKELSVGGGRLFVDRYGELIKLSASGQIAMRHILEAHLRRVEWDQWQFPVRLYPFVASEALSAERPIAIDPSLAFGRPVVLRRGITTSVIAERIDAGESLEALAADYDLSVAEIEGAILYQRAPLTCTDRPLPRPGPPCGQLLRPVARIGRHLQPRPRPVALSDRVSGVPFFGQAPRLAVSLRPTGPLSKVRTPVARIEPTVGRPGGVLRHPSAVAERRLRPSRQPRRPCARTNRVLGRIG
jgi:uncharacterized protein (DUF433 family)